MLGDDTDGAHFVHFEEMPKGQAEVILPALGALLDKAGFTQGTRFSKIAVTIGPGSFTGLRVGLATAKARCVADQCPLVPLNRLHLIALCAQLDANQALPVQVAVDARRGEHFVQRFDAALLPLIEAMTLPAEDVSAWLAAGAAQHSGLTASDGTELFCSDVLSQAMLQLAATQPQAPHGDVRPLYVRPPDAKRPKQTRFTLT